MNDTGHQIRFKLLGPVGPVVKGQVITMGGERMRTLLAVLLINSAQTVNKDQLIQELWGDHAPGGVVNALQAAVARLRGRLRETCVHLGKRLITSSGGYLLNVAPEELDAAVFEDLVERSAKVAITDPNAARELLNAALRLRTGPILQGVTGGPLCHGAALKYEESWLSAVEAKIDVDISVGNTCQAIPELRRMATMHPWRERFTEMLMLSLYREGRQAEAVAAYNQARTRLVEELGMEPSPPLQRQVRAILNQDPALQSITTGLTTT